METRRSGLFAVLHTSSVLESRVEAKLSEIGLSLPKLAALHRLSEAGDSLPLGQLAERLSCVKSNVTQLVDRLEADGLVCRASDPNDKRSRLAFLTGAGRMAYEKGRQIHEEMEREFFGALTESESATLHALLAKLKG
jgi:DNA-binding MarR family transcriptional regulator